MIGKYCVRSTMLSWISLSDSFVSITIVYRAVGNSTGPQGMFSIRCRPTCGRSCITLSERRRPRSTTTSHRSNRSVADRGVVQENPDDESTTAKSVCSPCHFRSARRRGRLSRGGDGSQLRRGRGSYVHFRIHARAIVWNLMLVRRGFDMRFPSYS